MKQAKTTKQPLEVGQKYHIDIVPFNSLKVGDQFKFTYEGDIVRTVSQIGRTEMYCPIDGSNTMGHSKAGGEEVYAKSDKPVIKLTPIPDSKEGLHTGLPWRIASQNFDTGFYVIHGIDNSCPDREVQVLKLEYGAHPVKEYLQKAKANAELIVKAVNERQALLDSRDALAKALQDAHKQLHFMCDMYCRDKDGYLKDNNKPGAWDAELDIRIEQVLKEAGLEIK